MHEDIYCHLFSQSRLWQRHHVYVHYVTKHFSTWQSCKQTAAIWDNTQKPFFYLCALRRGVSSGAWAAELSEPELSAHPRPHPPPGVQRLDSSSRLAARLFQAHPLLDWELQRHSGAGMHLALLGSSKRSPGYKAVTFKNHVLVFFLQIILQEKSNFVSTDSTRAEQRSH